MFFHGSRCLVGLLEELYCSSCRSIALCWISCLVWPATCFATAIPALSTQDRMVEWTVESKRVYGDPFNDVDVDVIFERNGESWRVPTFWRGGNKWTVRFAPPTPGAYRYHLESTDKHNQDLNGHAGTITVNSYRGGSPVLRHGMIRVSANKRYFEYADGTPFYWLGDTWWTGLSDRLPWDGFKRLAIDRQRKGFTAIQIDAGLVPDEELAPSDPGFCNEGGCVWTSHFEHINPRYFDFADRRIQYLLDHGLVPVIVGAWCSELRLLGASNMEKHWRYIIARYGAYPVIWVAGGEVYEQARNQSKLRMQVKGLAAFEESLTAPGWTDVVRYIRSADPYHHPVSVHEIAPPFDTAISDESLTDFDLFQPSHVGWASIATEVALLDKHYARTTVTKPLVVGEVVYEGLGGDQGADMQRAAFWLGVLNGAAGFTYGAVGTWEAYDTAKPFQRMRLSLTTWDEGMSLPGSYEVGVGAKFLAGTSWWRIAPHPEWVTPHGTTLLEPNDQINGFDIDLLGAMMGPNPSPDAELPAGEWQKRKGNVRLPYAAGTPGKIRIVYTFPGATPTILELEPETRYHAFYWDPETGTKFDLGTIARPRPGRIILADEFDGNSTAKWTDFAAKATSDSGAGEAKISVAEGVSVTDAVVSIESRSAVRTGLILRFHDSRNYLAAIYAPKERNVYLIDRQYGENGTPLAVTPAPNLGAHITLCAEVRGGVAAVSVSDGDHSYTSSIVDIGNRTAGGLGVWREAGQSERASRFEARLSPALVTDAALDRELYDAEGRYRGTWRGKGNAAAAGYTDGMPSMDDWGRDKHILLDAYRPDSPPFGQDWVVVLEASQ